MDVKSTWISTWHWMDHVSWSLGLFSNPPLGGRPNIKLGDHGTLYTHNRRFILFYHVWGPAWIVIHCESIWSRAHSHMTSHYTWGSMTTLHDLKRPLDTLLLGSHNFMVTGSWLVCEVALNRCDQCMRKRVIKLATCVLCRFLPLEACAVFGSKVC